MTLEGRQKEEARMSERFGARRGRWVIAAALVLAVVAALGVVGSATARSGAGCGTVTLKGQGEPVQEPGVRLAGDVPRRRPLLRAEGQGAHPGARAELQVRLGRRGTRAGRTLEPALQAAQAGALLLVRPAVSERDVQARPDPAAEALRRLQGR